MSPLEQATLVVTVFAIVINVAAAVIDLLRIPWLMSNMTRIGVPHSWVIPLAVIKLAGALGLLFGLVFPPLGLLAAIGLVLYFVGAVIAVLRARWPQNLPYPASYLVVAIATLALQLVAG